jgi:uncharacterized protein YjbI with pentapeptide repeats
MKSLLLLSLTVLSLCVALPVEAENLEHTQQLLSTNQCPDCDLSRIGLVYADLSGADLSRANLTQANLSRANLSGTNLSNANLAGAVLFNANLRGADLRGADLRGADLRGAILVGVNVQGAKLDGANFLGAVGLPSEVATVENLYRFGLAEAERGNYRGAIGYYNQVASQEPEFAGAYLARGVARFRLGEQALALEDAQQAEQLYLAQGNEEGHQAAVQFNQGIQAIQAASEEQKKQMEGNGIGIGILNILGTAASLFLRFGLP